MLFQKTPKQYHSAEFDLGLLPILAIEREKDETVISYLDSLKEPQIFTLQCSPEKHDQLVSRLTNSVMLKEKSL